MLPATLQALKDQAKAVQQDAAAIESAKDAAWKAALIEAARANLGDLWQYTGGQPSRYQPWEAAFEVCLPGHRPVYAQFCVLNSGHSFWARQPWHGGRATDVPGEHAWWMADRGEGRTLGHYHTLGAALLAAEIEPPKRPAPRPPVSDEPVPF